MRPAVCILTVFGAFVGALLVTVPRGDPVDWFRLVVALVGAWGVAMSTQITNDVADREIDAIDKPDRPIPSGKITVDDAQTAGILGYALSIICGIMVSWTMAAFYTGIVIISIHYNYHGKGLPLIGNIEVAVCVASIPIFGAASQLRPWDLWFLFLFIFVFEIGRELVVTAQDVEADKAQDLKTLPVYIGQKASFYVAAIFYAASVFPVMYSEGAPGFGQIFIFGSYGLLVSLFGTMERVVSEDFTFEAYEKWIRTRGRFFILLYQFVLLIEVFW